MPLQENMCDTKSPVFPLLFKLEGRTALVVGAGNVATRRILSLLHSSCKIKVVAQSPLPEELAVYQVATNQSVANQFAAQQLAKNQPEVQQLSANQPTSHQLAANRLEAQQLVENQPAAHQLAPPPQLTFTQCAFAPQQLEGCSIAIAATNDRAVNHAVYQACKVRGVLVNVCDAPEECDFYFPALFETDTLIGGVVSKQGNAHTAVKQAAQRIREVL